MTRTLANRVFNWVRFKTPGPYLDVDPRRRDEPGIRLRRGARTAFADRFPAVVRFGLHGLCLAYWPVAQLGYYRWQGMHRSLSRRKRLKLIVEASRLQLSMWEYTNALACTRLRGKAHNYLSQWEFGLLMQVLNRYGRSQLLNDKREFAKMAQHCDLQVPQTMAIVEPNRVQWLAQYKEGVAGDLVSKPALGSASRGTCLWHRQGDGRYLPQHTVGQGGAVDLEGVLEQLQCQAASDNPVLLQEALEIHPSIRDLQVGALPACRILSSHVPCEKPRLLSAVMIIPSNNLGEPFEFFWAQLDLVEGRLGQIVVPAGPEFLFAEVHPNSGVRVEGRRLPDWSQARELVLRAHQAIEGIPIIGWDVALTDRGPRLLEGNLGPGVVTHQIADGVPLGESDIGVACLAALEYIESR